MGYLNLDLLAKIALFTVTGTAALAPPQSTREYLQHLVGQRLILRHYGASNAKVKEKDLSTARGGCDQAVEVTTVSFEKSAVRLQLRNIGTPAFGNQRVACGPDLHSSLKITDFDIDQPLDQAEKSIESVLQTPESFLAALGSPWELPHSPE